MLIQFKNLFTTVKNTITLEPIIACYIFANGFVRPAFENLELEKSCRVNLQFNETICKRILNGDHANLTQENQEILVEISRIRSWQTPIHHIFPLIIVLFLGSFTDRHRCRKPFLLIPFVGEIISLMGSILCVVFMEQWSLEILGLYQKIIPSFFGGQSMMIITTYTYLTDVTAKEKRTFHIGLIQIIISITALIVQLISSAVFLKLGYILMMSISILVAIFGFFYGLIYINDKTDQSISCSIFIDFFNPVHVIDTFKLLFIKKENSSRKGLIMSILIISLFKFAFIGHVSILFLYTQKELFWTPVQFGYLLAVKSLVNLFGTTGGLALFTKLFPLDDLLIILIAVGNKIIIDLIFANASTSLHMYIGIGLSLFSGLTRVANRSLATKIICKDDVGKAQSLFGICDAIIPIIAVPVYNEIYIKTISFFPAAFLYISILIYVICSAIVVTWYFVNKLKRNNVVLRRSSITTSTTTKL